ncbi:MAG TPA: antibiotic biosynthesis monooxygenase [Bryobacteraceae bacterium]|jgi:heme-degrading monooxygenase HmoA|nr:antibiotic biosynthesis monooxygenase [Bryobacteraceae bacterium]
MVVILFRSRLTAEAGGDYHHMAAEMLATAREMRGFIEYKAFRADDGERISVIWWKDLDARRLAQSPAPSRGAESRTPTLVRELHY